MTTVVARLCARLGLQLPLVQQLAEGNWLHRSSSLRSTWLDAPACAARHATWSTPATSLVTAAMAARHIQTQSLACGSAAAEAACERLPRDDACDTIAALSSGPGRSGVAVIRLSGPRAGACSCPLGPNSAALPLLSSAFHFACRPHLKAGCCAARHASCIYSLLMMFLYGLPDLALQRLLKPGQTLPQPRMAVRRSIRFILERLVQVKSQGSSLVSPCSFQVQCTRLCIRSSGQMGGSTGSQGACSGVLPGMPIFVDPSHSECPCFLVV